MARSESDARIQARRILASGDLLSPDHLFELVRRLKMERAFGLARRVLECHSSDAPFTTSAARRVKLAQDRALCTYKDPDLPADEKLDRALAILRDIDLETTRDRETLGLAGAVYKRKWELTTQERDLETSFYYYHRGYTEGNTEDYGYNGINAAFTLDLIADHEAVQGRQPAGGLSTVELRRNQAREIREKLTAELQDLLNAPDLVWLKKTWWFLTTLGEAYYGLGMYTEARKWLLAAKALAGVPDWEQESTARQLATLLVLKRKLDSADAREAEEVLREFLGDDNALTSVIRGKVGLGLSGGGFRASLFHIGLLARMAELDLLRSVEYLSCVSGGSIIGAYYYLEARRLLESKPDDRITKQDYIDIVKRIERQFKEGVQRNIRTRILSEWGTNFKMMFVPDYSRTTRAGELYESELYARIADGGESAARHLDELIVKPANERADFAPKDHNWRRANKVPILVLNATALNTGHNWQFTASWMGEPPASIDSNVDSNYRLRRLYYSDAPDAHRKVRLGEAVAASACVPGIFDPLSLSGLYERGVVQPIVRLVDGGVHDNQGTSALLEQGCSVLIVSDASGQMESLDAPHNGLLSVPLRANGILQARVREAQYRELAARRRAGLLKGLVFLHMKQDLDVEPVDWVGCEDPSPAAQRLPRTRFGVQKHIQRGLASIRTDLDSFSDAEAYALMCDAYLMSSHLLKPSALGFDVPGAPSEDWQFLRIRPLLEQPAGRKNPLVAQLAVSTRIFFRVWSMSSALKALGCVTVFALLAGLAWLVYETWHSELVSLTVGGLMTLLLPIALSLVGLALVTKVITARKTAQQVLIGLGIVTVGAFLARLHLHIFDKLFLKKGKLERLLANMGSGRGVVRRGGRFTCDCPRACCQGGDRQAGCGGSVTRT